MSIMEKVKIIPCSGMGKVYGLMARESALYTVSHLCSDQAETMCLAYIVTGDDEAEIGIDSRPCITIDGCPKMCAAKSVATMGGDIKEEFKIFDIMNKYEGVQPGTATVLTDDGWTIVEEIAGRLRNQIHKIIGEER